MAMPFQKPKGTQDFYPEDLQIREKIFNILRKTAINYNFKEVESPAFENLDLLTKKEGEEITSQIFNLEKKGDESFGLRFDLTVPAARMFIEKQKELPKPVKWFYISRMWRYEKPQAGRLREFYQTSCEIFGSSKPEADAEIINLATGCLISLGLAKKDFIVKLNNRKLLEGLLLDIVSKDKIPEVMRLIDKRSKLSPEAFDSELKKTNLDPKKINNLLTLELDEIKPKNKLAEEGLGELKSVMRLTSPECTRFDLSTARGLAYYSGTVFEIFDAKSNFRALAGGGRYDQLIELLGGQPTPATGFAMGYATLNLFLQEKGLLPQISMEPEFYIGVVDEQSIEKAIAIANKLRINSVVEMDLMQRNIGNQLKYANAIKAKKVIVVGPDEIKSGNITIKDMKTGKEVKKRISDL